MQDARGGFAARVDSVAAADAATFAELALELRASGGVEETVDAVVQFAVHALGCSHAGVALTGRHGPEVPAATDPLVAEIFQFVADTGEGPLIDAFEKRTAVLVRDLCRELRWPGWSRKAASLGVGSALIVPLATYERTVGALGLFSDRIDAFDTDDEAVAHILARHASVAVVTAREEEGLAQAIDGRTLIGQATGILMERYDIDSDHAFAVLRRYSQVTNSKLRDVARELVETRRLPQ